MPELKNMNNENKTIFTIGHSTLSTCQFIGLLKENNIQLLADIRAYPGSRKFPQFNKDNLSRSLRENGIGYVHLPGLGGRRKRPPLSQPTGWKNESFQNYAAYMQTAEFAEAIAELESLAGAERIAYMCSEAVWWRCHRSLVSDYLKSKGWKVLHILNGNHLKEHPYTAVASITNGNLSYPVNETEKG